MRLTEPQLATWTRFRGHLTATDLLSLLFEDAAVLHKVPFDPTTLGGPIRLSALPSAVSGAWLGALDTADLKTPGADYIAQQARLLGLPTRMARSDLHVVNPHQKVLELPGTGGQLAHHIVSSQRDVTLQDNFVLACSSWQELTLAGVVALDLGAPHTDPPFLDGFAAALCLFELYAGRHAFEGKVPEPGQKSAVREDDIDPPGLAAFFDKALDPAPERRYPLARAMRDALVVALGDDVDAAAAPAPALEDPCHRRCRPRHRAAPDRIALAEYDDATGEFNGFTLPIQDGPAVVAHASRWPPRPAPLSIRLGGPRYHRVCPRHPQPPRRSRSPAMLPSLSALNTKAATMRRLRMRSQTSCARSSREVVRHIVSAPDAENISIVLEFSAENSDRFSENVARTARENSRVLSLYNSDFEDVKW